MAGAILNHRERLLKQPQLNADKGGHFIGVHLRCKDYGYNERTMMTVPGARKVLTPRAGIFLAGLLMLYRVAEVRAQEPAAFLREYIHMDDDQIASLDRGQTFAKILDVTHPAEVPVFGAIRVKVPAAFFIEKYRDIVTFKKSKEVLQIGKFHLPPKLEDLDPLTIDQSDLDAIKKCAVGDCPLKLPAETIERFRKNVNWSSRDCSNQASALYKQVLFEQARAYLTSGNAALPVYSDKKSPVRLADESVSILQASPYLSKYAPALVDYLRDYPKAEPARSEEMLYWSKEKFGYKAVVSMTHVTIYRTDRPEAEWTLIASKQIYASHYFQGSLGLAMFLESKGPAPGADGCLMYLNRSRADLPFGFLSGLIRYFLRRRVLDGTDKYLRLIKDRLESEYQVRPGTHRE
jgi:hypothetical protein